MVAFVSPLPLPRSAAAMPANQVMLHDSELVLRFQAGNEAAFVEIVMRHRGKMFLTAFAMLRNRADAEEVAQDTFIRAHRGLATFRGDASLSTWLHHIALNLARNRYWYSFRRGRNVTTSIDLPLGHGNSATLGDLVATGAANPAREAMTREFAELVTLCIARLGARPRQILTLRNSLHLSYGEIARRLGIKIGTVKSRLTRARESLRLLLTKACPEFRSDARLAEWFETDHAMGVEIIRT